MMKRIKESIVLVLVILLLGLSIFSLYRYAPLLKAKQELEKQNQESRLEISQLRSDLNSLKEALQTQKGINQKIETENINLHTDIAKLNEELDLTQQQLEVLTSNLLALSRENVSLQEESQILTERLEKALQDKKNILAKIDTVEELKKLVSQVKKQILRNKLLLQRRLDEKKLADGNKGFVVKDGRDTYQPKVHIEVKPTS